MGFVSGYNEAQSDDTQQIKVVGMPAHKWLLSRRIELAKEKLRDGRSSLSDVAWRAASAIRATSRESSADWLA